MVELIAEIGWNHLGNMPLAISMVEAAAESGADYAKFQTFSLDRLRPGPWDNDGRKDLYKKAELSYEDHLLLRDCCYGNGLKFMSTAFCVEDAKLLRDVSDKCIKIPSLELRNQDLLRYCNDNFQRVFVSTGTSTMAEVALATARVAGEKLTLLHCVSCYPCPPENANLPRIEDLQELSKSVGYSDHVLGIHAAMASLDYDVVVIEKHFTTDKSLPGRDNAYAITPDEMSELSEYINVYNKVKAYHGADYQEIEREAREVYSGRWGA